MDQEEWNAMKGKAVTKCSERCIKVQVSDNKRRNLYYREGEVLRSNEMILFSFNRTLLLSINKMGHLAVRSLVV